MDKDYGEPIRYDPNFNGPIHNRSCTDTIWLILFILFLGVWGFVGYYGMTHGNVQKLLAPIDSNGHRCGIDSGVENKPYRMFFDIAKCLSPETSIIGCPTPQVCVNQCPTRTVVFGKEMTESNFASLKSDMVCTNDVNVNAMSYTQAKEYMQQDKCAKYVLQSQPGNEPDQLCTVSCENGSRWGVTNLSRILILIFVMLSIWTMWLNEWHVPQDRPITIAWPNYNLYLLDVPYL